MKRCFFSSACSWIHLKIDFPLTGILGAAKLICKHSKFNKSYDICGETVIFFVVLLNQFAFHFTGPFNYKLFGNSDSGSEFQSGFFFRTNFFRTLINSNGFSKFIKIVRMIGVFFTFVYSQHSSHSIQTLKINVFVFFTSEKKNTHKLKINEQQKGSIKWLYLQPQLQLHIL